MEMSVNEWIDELDSRINHSLIDNVQYVNLHIDDLISLNECIKEYINNGNSD
jgi:hypothetical protein